MQKKIIALAIAAAFTAPVAMADVTVYGTLDGGWRHQTNDSPAQGTTDSMQLGQYNTSRWGIKSVEDMDGMKTNVVLEGSITTPLTAADANLPTATGGNNGFDIFDRQATLGVSAGWGAIDLGYNYTTSFKVIKSYDPLDYKWLGQAGAKTSDLQDRAGMVAYTGKFGGVTVLGEYDVNNASKTTQPQGPAGSLNGAGTGRAVGAMFKGGPVSVGAAYSTIEAGVGADNPVTHVTAGAGFNFGDGAVKAGYAKMATKTAVNDNTDTNMWIGGDFHISSSIDILAAYYSNTKNSGNTNAVDTTKKIMIVGMTYDMSKKTQLYVSADRTVSNNGSTDSTATGTTLGLSTAF